jgi:hypothetical protein
MKTKSLVLTLLSAASLLGAAGASHAQSTKNQAGGLPALADEVAALRTLVEDLQEEVGGSGDPYAGTYGVTLVETALFGCGVGNPPPTGPLLPYLMPQANSSVAVRSSTFEAASDGSTLTVPDFTLLTHELRLSGRYQTETPIEEGAALIIGGDGSLHADFGDAVLTGQFSSDGSLFTALVQGRSPEGSCVDAWTVNLTGVKK